MLASQYRMLTVLREVESYLIAAKIPLIRKLEFAVELRMARLYDMTMREIGPNAIEEVCCIHIISVGGLYLRRRAARYRLSAATNQYERYCTTEKNWYTLNPLGIAGCEIRA